MMHPDRFFSPIPEVRGIARTLYARVADRPLVCPHGHVDPQVLAQDTPFPDPAALIVIPDHYLLRMLYSQGVPMEALGVPRRDGGAVETDPRRIWQTFAEHFHLFRGTPSGVWLRHELEDVFGVQERLDGGSALRTYDRVAEHLATPAVRPRALFERFRIEVLCTTDAAGDSLWWHQQLRASGWAGDVRPTFRPDLAIAVTSPGWKGEITRIAEASGVEIDSYASYIRALEHRRAVFKSLGASATDHAVVTPWTERLPDASASAIFDRALAGTATADDERAFTGHMLMEMARMSTEDGLVMQIHPGSERNHNAIVYERFGADRGGDMPVATEYTRNLRHLLNAYGNDSRFRLIVFTLDETTYSRELAPLAGHYTAMLLGAPWWFHDSIEGMMRFRRATTETAGIENTAGFTDDTRAFCSIPARHDLARRVDANYLGGLVARHVIDMSDAREMARLMAYDLARRAYRLTEETGD